MPPAIDDLGRPLISDLLKQQMSEALNGIPSDKRAALIFVGDANGDTRFQVAARLGDHWKVAGGVGFDWQRHEAPVGFVAVVGAW